jgi:hypothetical protein
VRSEACTSLRTLAQAVPTTRQQIQTHLETTAEHDTCAEVRSDAQRAIETIA